MRNSLIVKLMGAFLLVIGIGATVIAILTSIATKDAFTLYTTRNGQMWAQNLSPILADFYAQSNSWKGVEAVLASNPIGGQLFSDGTGMMMGQGQGRGNGAGRQSTGNGMMAGSGQRVILLDEQNMVIADTQNTLIGSHFSTEQVNSGASILVDNRVVGTVIVTPNDITGAGTPAGEFLSSVNRAIISSAVIATIIAIILGTMLFLQITAPLRKLKQAATAIGQGDLQQRVNIQSHDEFADLGESFNRMAENLAGAEIQRQHLMADVAHELRTPLTAIQGTLEAMQDRILPLDDEQLDALYTQTTLLNRLISDLRLLSLAEAGQLKLDLSLTDSATLVQQITEGMKPLAQEKSIQLLIEIQPDLPRISLDPDRIAQVLNNLISNSIRYTPVGGKIFVQSVIIPMKNFLNISVTDSGPGIGFDDLAHIFDRFYRADKSRTRNSGGSGLGLAIVKQLIEAHGGRVHAESPVFYDEDHHGFGTKIYFTLPF